jgi:hypothetical protein
MERWLIHANITRLEFVLKEELTEAQRSAIERLIAEQRAKLDTLSLQGEPARTPA